MKKITMTIMMVMMAMAMGTANASPYPNYYFSNAVQQWNSNANNWKATQADKGHQALCNKGFLKLRAMEAEIPFIASNLARELQWRRSARLFSGLKQECAMYFTRSQNEFGKKLKSPKHYTGDFTTIARLLKI